MVFASGWLIGSFPGLPAIFFSELCQFYGLGLLQCLHLVGPKQQDRIGKASESASDSF